MVLHSFHNGLIMCVAHWQDDLAANGFGVEEAAHLPAMWLVVAAGGISVAIVWLLLSTRPVMRDLAAPLRAT
jgi:hypothetical protein